MIKKIKLSLIYGCVFLFVGCGGGGSDSNSTAQPQEPLEDFSFPLHDISNPIVGDLKDYTLEDVNVRLTDNIAQRKILTYKMLGVTGQVTNATAIVFIPTKQAPVSGYKTVVWAHGTTGVADICAPSSQGLAVNAIPLINRLLDEGYVIIAPNYEC